MTKIIVYDHLKLLRKENRAALEKDLQERFDLGEIESIKVGKIDTVKKSARLQVSFKDLAGSNFMELD